MATAATAGSNSLTWFEQFKLNGYFLKPVVIGTLFTGIYLHLSVLFFGHDLVVDHVATPAFDRLLALTITYGAIVSWIMWPRVEHPSGWHRFVFGASLFTSQSVFPFTSGLI